MSMFRHWGLGAKLALVALPFVLAAVALVGATLWVSWQLQGGAAAVNEAGRMRMQANRLSLSIAVAVPAAIASQTEEFERSLRLLRDGDPLRPLFVPWDDGIRDRFGHVSAAWDAFRGQWVDAPAETDDPRRDLPAATAAFTRDIDMLVGAIETQLARWTAILHLLQSALLALSVVGACGLLLAGYLLVLEPVAQLRRGIERLQAGDLAARVSRPARDEFGALAAGFNEMADHLQTMYQQLEAKVASKTAELQVRRERLEALYRVAGLAAQASTLDELARGFVQQVRQVAHADAVALRWSDEDNARYMMLASDGLPDALLDAERCLPAHQCHCGVPQTGAGTRVIAIASTSASGTLGHCGRAGFRRIVALPVRLHERQLGELELFFHAEVEPGPAERSLLEALTAHLASAMDNLRLRALEREAAICGERELLARELHDSIAQSLAFLKIQVQLLREALETGNAERMRDALSEIDLGVRESYADVRELLLNFRVRTSDEDIQAALRATLRKFEHHSGLRATLTLHGHGLPLPADAQVQVLHVVQEALSNARKHAQASQVWVDVWPLPQWRFEVRDDGCGFDPAVVRGETHVGQRIMAERAAQIGARLTIESAPGAGTRVTLELPMQSPEATAIGSTPGQPVNGMLPPRAALATA